MTLAWAPGGSFGSPTYSLPIQVVDSVRSTFIDKRRRWWTQARDAALARWALPFEVTLRPESEQAFRATDDTISRQSVNPLIVADAIALVRMHSDIAGDSAGWIDQMGGGICLVTPYRSWWMREIGKGEIASVVAHEVGHALGFGHPPTSIPGVMSGGYRPSDQERQLAADYYGV